MTLAKALTLSLAAAGAALQPAAAADIRRGQYDESLPAYIARSPGYCDLELAAVHDHALKRDGLPYQLILFTPVCADQTPPLAQSMSVLGEMFAKLRDDGYDLHNFSTLSNWGGFGWLPWRDRLADCYIARFGANDRRKHRMTRASLKACPVFTELNAVLEPYGVAARILRLDYVAYDDLTSPKWDLGDAWMAAHRGARGRVVAEAAYDLEFVPVHRSVQP